MDIKKEKDLPYSPGREINPYHLPLNRFFPPLIPGMISAFVGKSIQKGDWILDPYTTNPALSLELARSGFKVMTVINNPVIRLILHNLAKPHSSGEYLAVLNELAVSRRGDLRMGDFLASVYETTCNVCHQIIPADMFLWHREQAIPISKIYHCPHCGDHGERSLEQFDLEKIQQIHKDRLHLARAYQRIDIGQDTEEIQTFIHYYSRRSIYFIFSVLNRIEGLDLDPHKREILLFLLLSCCDEGSRLWSANTSDDEPQHFAIPSVYREKNLWQLFKHTAEIWETSERPVEVVEYPDLPERDGAICIFPGRLSSLAGSSDLPDIKIAVTFYPRPSPLFWTFTAAWSGWYWGKDAITPLKSVFNRKRYDWHWYLKATFYILKNLGRMQSGEFRFFALIPSENLSHLFASLASAQLAGFCLKHYAYNYDDHLLQGVWQKDNPEKESQRRHQSVMSDMAEAIAVSVNQPATYPELFLAGCLYLEKNKAFAACQAEHGPDMECLRGLLQQLHQTLDDDTEFLSVQVQRKDYHEKFYLSIKNPPVFSPIFTEKIELSLLQYLFQIREIPFTEMLFHLNGIFPGLNTPSQNVVHEALLAYGEKCGGYNENWRLRRANSLSLRSADVTELVEKIVDMGKKFGYTVRIDELPYRNRRHDVQSFFGKDILAQLRKKVIWSQKDDSIECAFIITPYNIVSDLIMEPDTQNIENQVLVIPASQSRWFLYKLERYPQLADHIQKKWKVVKFRHIRSLAEILDIDSSRWKDMLENDPIQWEDIVQMKIFSQTE